MHKYHSHSSKRLGSSHTITVCDVLCCSLVPLGKLTKMVSFKSVFVFYSSPIYSLKTHIDYSTSLFVGQMTAFFSIHSSGSDMILLWMWLVAWYLFSQVSVGVDWVEV